MVSLETQQSDQRADEFLSKQLDAEDIPERLGSDLRGEWFDPKKREYTNVLYVDEDGKEIKAVPKLNEQGIRDICIEVRARIRNVYGSANLSEQQIRSTRMGIAKAVWQILRINREKYNLSVENMLSILFMIDDQVLLFLSRTEKSGFFKGLGKLLGRTEQVNYTYSDQMKNAPEYGQIKKGLF